MLLNNNLLEMCRVVTSLLLFDLQTPNDQKELMLGWCGKLLSLHCFKLKLFHIFILSSSISHQLLKGMQQFLMKNVICQSTWV